MNRPLSEMVRLIGQILSDKCFTVTTVESCTGGGIAQVLTGQAGSSAWFEQGVITYSNQAKAELVNVPLSLIETQGAVSEDVASAMAEGGLVQSNADFALSVTGIAGPGGGSDEKPVGTVCFAWASKDDSTITSTQLFSGDRTEVRDKSVAYSLSRFLELLILTQNG